MECVGNLRLLARETPAENPRLPCRRSYLDPSNGHIVRCLGRRSYWASDGRVAWSNEDNFFRGEP
jgi:hypothetical protein